ncbi:MAG: DegT/DnrJ/EryC1/StrS family aminotransferase [Gammaproteobacteria bacterium]|nr:DegT/DnrJ/EryC1/StrS family aminotransferase [Gammaproteobacteria bacterium]
MAMCETPIRFQVSKPVLAGREKEYILDALQTGWISGSGYYVDRFEEEVSSFLNISDGIAVSNGTVALHLACLGMDLGPGMDVIVPSLTYVASANAVRYCGANPVFADCDPYTWNVTCESIEAVWTKKTVGVLLVHLYGLPAPVHEIRELCQQRSAWLIEDCAESFGAKMDGCYVGGFGDISTFSFFANKIISTGEGGMVFVKDKERREFVRKLKGQGVDLNRPYWHTVVGYNYRMSNVVAAIGLAQIEMAESHLAERRRIAQRYIQTLKLLHEHGLVRLPVEPSGYHNVHWLFSLVLASGTEAVRDRVRQELLRTYGIETRPFFVPMHRLPMYSSEHSFPHADFISDRGINLPTYTGLSDADIDEISAIVSDVAKREMGA